MNPETQANFRLAVKTELLKRDMTVTRLAATIRKSRTATSLAINRGGFARVRKLIKKELNLR